MARIIKQIDNPRARFALASTEAKPRLITANTGEVGTGKTTFCLGAPGPILVQSFDMGLEGVVESIIKDTGKEIRVQEYAWSPTTDLSQEDAVLLRDQFIADYEFACEHFRTVIWDKETSIWELFRYAEFGAPNDAPRNYPALNQRYRRYINMPKSLDINFCCIQSMKNEWVTKAKGDGTTKGVSTGGRIRQGFSELDELVHIDIHHRYDKVDGQFYIDVGKSRGPGSREVQGQTMVTPTFAEFGQMVFPETTEEDWQ